MAVTLTTVLPEQAEAVGVMMYESFRDIAERHNFEPTFRTPEFAQVIVRLLAQSEGYESFLLVEEGQPLACNFGDERDEVVGVGPVAVAVGQQGGGLGRRVMEALLERAEQGGFTSVRLIQSAYNMQSFSLYHKLGFEVKDALASLHGRPPDDETPTDLVREYTPDDLDACDALHRDVLGVGRRHDIEYMANFAPPVVVERDGRVAGYLTRFPGDEVFVTHGVARDEQALRDLIIGTSRAVPGELRLTLPTGQPETLRWAMGNGRTATRRGGFRLMELGTYMVRGDYQPPMGAWIPSPFY
jgi:GNAT superfamily N-acetyltransferase